MSKKTRIKLVGDGWIKLGFKKNHILEYENFEGFLVSPGGIQIYKFDPLYSFEILPDEPAPMPEPEKPFEFRSNDRVTCAFFGKEVFTLGESDEDNFLWFLKGSKEYHFYEDGRYNHEHTAPVLTLVERPKRTVKETYWVATWTNKAIALPLTAIADSLESIKKSCERFQGVQFHEITREENE